MLIVLHQSIATCPKTCQCGATSVKCNQITREGLKTLPKGTLTLELNLVPSLKVLSSNDFDLPNLKNIKLKNTFLERLSIANNTSRLKTVSITGGIFKHYEDISIDNPLDYLIIKSLPLTPAKHKYSFRNIKKIYFERNSVRNFDTGAFDVPQVTSIIFKHNPITHVAFKDNAKQLYIAQIDRCSISQFENIDIQTKSLRILRLGKNLLRSPTSFIDFGNLRELSLNSNEITVFRSENFNLSQLENLVLGDNPLVDLHLSSPNLLRVEASDTKLKVLDTSTFNTPKLMYMKFDRSSISKLNLKKGSENVRVLHLSNCHITHFYSSQHRLPFIEEIDLRKNPLTHIELSNGLQNLRRLFLDNCNLTALTLQNSSLSNIEVLTINGNPLKDMDFHISLPKLKIFEAKSTAITKVDLDKCQFDDLSTIKFDGTPLVSFDLGACVPRLTFLSLKDTKVRSLVLKHSLLEVINLDNSPITNITIASAARKLTLKHTNITVFDTKKVNSSMLQFLDISFSPIEQLFFDTRAIKLRTLNAKGTKLRSFNSTDFSLPSLTHLVLSRSPLRELDLSKLLNIQYVYADFADLSVFNSTGYQLPHISTLRLSSNPLKVLDITNGLEALQTLSLTNTSLTHFDNTIANLPNLVNLHVSGTHLQFVTLSQFPKLRTLDLAGSRNLKKIYFDADKLKYFNRLNIDSESLFCDCEWLDILQERRFHYNLRMCKGWESGDTVFSIAIKLECSTKKRSSQPYTTRETPTTIFQEDNATTPTPTTIFPWGMGKVSYQNLLIRCLLSRVTN